MMAKGMRNGLKVALLVGPLLAGESLVRRNLGRGFVGRTGREWRGIRVCR